MSNYKSTLQSNNTDLQAILNTINELPEASGEQVTPTISVSSNGLITATAGAKSSTHQLAFQAAKTITPTTTSQTAVSSGYYTGGSVTVKGDSNLIAGNIKSGVSIFGVNGTYAGSGGDTDVEDGLITGTLTSYTNSRITTIGSYAFYGFSSLTTASFPKATSMGQAAFYYCSRLTTISFPKVTGITAAAFYSCSSLTTASFPNVSDIALSAFECCYRLTSISFPKATSIGQAAFRDCSSLTTASFPAATTIDAYAFYGCSNLTAASFPVAKYIDTRAFYYCSRLTTISFPKVASIGSNAFYSCASLTTASFPKATNIGTSAFYYCRYLKSLYLTGSSICTLSNSTAFSYTPIGGYSTSAGTYGSIYVPASLLTSYKTATNWTYFSSRFVGI